MWTRRHLLGTSALGLAGLSIPAQRALAGTSTNARKFIFVFNYGGWDPTRVFATEFDNRAVDMESSAGLHTIGDLRYVAHNDRSSVSTFFETYASRSLIINGLLVPSVAHENCLKLAMTGTSADGTPDWPAVLANARAADFSMPHLVIAGPSFPGQLGGIVTRTGSSGQLDGLVAGDIIDWSDVPTGRPDSRAEEIMDLYLARRATAANLSAQVTRGQELTSAFSAALDRATELKSLQGVVDWDSTTALASQVDLAISALSLGLSRCVTLSYTGSGWDTHSNNDTTQSTNFEGLFSGLLDLMGVLSLTPGEQSSTLLEETVVVVMSEMGRTPALNDAAGKDHWPYTSALICGPGVTGGRSVGGFDSYYYGTLIDPKSGEEHDKGISLSTNNLGALLIEMAGLDPAAYLPGVPTLPGLLA